MCAVDQSRFALLDPEPGYMYLGETTLEERKGARPKTNSCLPHAQLSDTSSDEVYCQLVPGATFVNANGPHRSHVSLPDTKALFIKESCRCVNAFVGREWAHLHGPQGGKGSWHLLLSDADAALILRKGLGESSRARLGFVRIRAAVVQKRT